MTHRLRLISVAVAAASGAALVGTAWSQPSDLRLGGWNTTLSMTLPGKAPSSSQLKTCVTKEDVESLRIFSPDENCKVTQVQRSPQRVSGKQVCRREDGGTSEGEIDVRFDGPAAFTMTAVSRQSGKGVPAEVRMEMKGRWAQASCKGFDD